MHTIPNEPKCNIKHHIPPLSSNLTSNSIHKVSKSAKPVPVANMISASPPTTAPGLPAFSCYSTTKSPSTSRSRFLSSLKHSADEHHLKRTQHAMFNKTGAQFPEPDAEVLESEDKLEIRVQVDHCKQQNSNHVQVRLNRTKRTVTFIGKRRYVPKISPHDWIHILNVSRISGPPLGMYFTKEVPLSLDVDFDSHFSNIGVDGVLTVSFAKHKR